MVRYAWLAAFAFAGLAAVDAYAADSTKADEQVINKVEQEWSAAVKAQDKAFFEKNLSTDFTYGDELGGFSKNRSEFIDSVMKMPKVADQSVSDEAVRVYGSTAVATGRVSYKTEQGGGAIRYTDTYVKGPDGWKAVAGQETSTK
jgi:ketosteroid isomerase-like protein